MNGKNCRKYFIPIPNSKFSLDRMSKVSEHEDEIQFLWSRFVHNQLFVYILLQSAICLHFVSISCLFEWWNLIFVQSIVCCHFVTISCLFTFCYNQLFTYILLQSAICLNFEEICAALIQLWIGLYELGWNFPLQQIF